MSDIIERINAKNPSREDILELQKELERLSREDYRKVDRSTLVDIMYVEPDESLPPLERIIDYIKRIKNPYCYLCDGIVVSVKFSGTRSLADILKEAVLGGD
ncbi:MAG: hypothetical protein J6O61_01265 [Butyrivibrio sp.]|uniref:DUF6870 family protein n=1 Tax=Butyrivibrio sp. TaxID=28121 RepID=UPI001B27D12C|nr:hypothetical protein [Butyrivibrio sp.]MBO6239491.1 hypothetical protein [Butyrivibrio sp.]MBP3239096.1 hypothetical protein [Oribacterium sp.]